MSIEAGKELRVLFDVEPARIALDRFLYKFIARTHTRCPEMPVAQTDMPLRDGQAGLYPLFLMKSVHRIHPFIFCMVPVFRPVWCHGKPRYTAEIRLFFAVLVRSIGTTPPFWCHSGTTLSPHCGLMYPQDAAKAVSSFLLLSFSIGSMETRPVTHRASGGARLRRIPAAAAL